MSKSSTDASIKCIAAFFNIDPLLIDKTNFSDEDVFTGLFAWCLSKFTSILKKKTNSIIYESIEPFALKHASSGYSFSSVFPEYNNQFKQKFKK